MCWGLYLPIKLASMHSGISETFRKLLGHWILEWGIRIALENGLYLIINNEGIKTQPQSKTRCKAELTAVVK